jgi:hypothetical protein
VIRMREWYRVDRSSAIKRALGASAVLMATGSLVVGLSLLATRSPALRVVAAVVGFVSIAGGPILAFLGLRGPLVEELYLAMRDDGLVLHFEAPEVVIPWEAIERIAYDGARGSVRLRLRSGDDVEVARTFSGIATDALARKLDDCRRKADFHLLR